MDDLVFKGENNQALTTSLLVAEKFGKEHKNVLRDIENLSCSEEFRRLNFEHTPYIHPQNGQTYRMYIMTKDGFTFLVMGYTGETAGKFKEDYINAFNKMEAAIKSIRFQVPTSFREALLLAAQQQEQIENQQKQISQKNSHIAVLEKESEYTRVILQNKGTTLVTQIAQDYGMSAMRLNAKLRELGIQHKVRNQWILYGKYIGKGYVHSSSTPITHKDGREGVSLTTEWTQRGRLFLYEMLKANGILPLIEI